MLVSRNKRKLAEGYVQLIAKLLVHLLEYRMKDAAGRTLKITKLFDMDRRRRWSKCVRGLGTGNTLVSDRLRRECCSRRSGRRLSDYSRRSRLYRTRQVPGAAQRDRKNHENDDKRK